MDDVVYFACNDWSLEPKESNNICFNYLGSYKGCKEEEIVNKTADDIEKWLIDNKICVNLAVVGMSTSYYITAPRKVFEETFPELLPFIKNEPYDFLWIGDSKYFLDFKEENIGLNFIDINETCDEK